MKKLRVFQTVENKRIASGFPLRNLGTILLLLLVIPYLITFLFGNLEEGSSGRALETVAAENENFERNIYVKNITSLGNETIPLEIYVADKLARSIDSTYEMEAIKAQAVLIRSGLLAVSESAGSGKEICVEDEEYGNVLIPEQIWQAVSESAGVCIMWQDKPVSAPYFAVSNGSTRNGEELLLMEYPYLKSVVCSRDFLSKDFMSSASFEESEFKKIWEQMPGTYLPEEGTEGLMFQEELDGIKVYRDSTGYVLYLEWEGKLVSGEGFREAFMLSSSSFHMEKEGTLIIFSVKGSGHGLGMSQFAANEMAKEEEDYVDILNYFFDQVTITKIE